MAYKKPIHRSLLSGCAAFIVALCVVLSSLSYVLYSRDLHNRYNAQLTELLTYVSNHVDGDDLHRCILTGTDSPHRQYLQQFMNDLINDFEIVYLYMLIPQRQEHAEGVGVMVNVVSATSAEEFAAGETDIPFLYVSYAYSNKMILRYLTAWDSPEITCFEEDSGYGAYYTACKPITTSQGQTIALLCADIPIGELHSHLRNYVIINVLLTVAISVAFGSLLLAWIRKNVTGPVMELEKSANFYAKKSLNIREPELLYFNAPDIHTDNEVESLAIAISQMSENIRSSVREMVRAQMRAKNAEEQAEDMIKIAYQDALTHVKSKTAYYESVNELAEKIKDHQAEFAVVMVDLNNLKHVNDTWGHERGDEYILGSCEIISEVYKHSPVFRVGGDEFVVILQGQDYRRRGELYRQLEDCFLQAQEDQSRNPWQRYSAAAGMADYSGDLNDDVDQVFKRADQKMYQNKVEMKRFRRN